MILESIVTTVSDAGQVNIAPMGPIVQGNIDHPKFVLRPFTSSSTYQNLLATRRAVIHVTDDVMLIARAAVRKITDAEKTELVHSIEDGQWWPLNDCHRWFAVDISSVSGDEPRVSMQCSIVHSKVVRPYFGLNRAKHAVIEAAILATRTHLLPAEEIEQQVQQLSPLIEKTAGQIERDAFRFLCHELGLQHVCHSIS